LSRSRNLCGKTFGAQAAAGRIEPVCLQLRHRAAPAVERLRMHAAIERITAARAARAALGAGNGRFHDGPDGLAEASTKK
jgi:hypothetical protein